MTTEQTRAFTTAARRAGPRTITIDDETFTVASVGLGIADRVAQAQGMLPVDGSPQKMSSEALLSAAEPFIAAEDWERFAAYCKQWVAPSEFAEVVQYLLQAVTGRNPTQPASSVSGSSSDGLSSTDGAPPAA